MRSNPRNSLEIPRVLRCVTDVLWWLFLAHQGRVSVRGSRSILQGFQKVRSNSLYLGTPLAACRLEELRKALKGQAIQRNFPNCLLPALRPKYRQ